MKKLYFVLIISTFVLFGCSGDLSSNQKTIPGLNINLNEMNVAFVISTSPDFESNYVQNHILLFNINNISTEEIHIDGENVKIFQKKQDRLIEISNLMGYPTDGFSLLPKKEFPIGLYIPILPDFCKLNYKDEIRIIIIGKEIRTQKNVAAYKDLKIITGETPNTSFCQK